MARAVGRHHLLLRGRRDVLRNGRGRSVEIEALADRRDIPPATSSTPTTPPTSGSGSAGRGGRREGRPARPPPLPPRPSRKTRLKDLVTVKGARENHVVGHGLVVGLNGTGDGGGTAASALRTMLRKLGRDPAEDLSSKNVAAAVVTAKLPPFPRAGQRTDATVSSIGTASSLAGGTLLVTPLKGGDGRVYAVAGGALSVGGRAGDAAFPTTATIPGGATVEREIPSGSTSRTPCASA